MKVKILGHTPNPEIVCALGAQTSYKKKDPSIRLEKLTLEKARKTLKRVMSYGHVSVIEHANFNILFEGVSSVFHQFLIEHRLASYTIRSKRYVDFSDVKQVVPEFFENKPKLKEKYKELIDLMLSTYRTIVQKGIRVEEARFFLPYCMEDNIVCTMNARELLHLLYACLYGHGRKYPEILKIGNILWKQLKEISPTIFDNILIIERGKDEKEKKLRELVKNENKKTSNKKVRLLYYTENADNKVARIALIKYTQSENIDDILKKHKNKIIDIVTRNRRARELENVTFTFKINNLSLGTLTHLTRHRIHNLVTPSFTEYDLDKEFLIPKGIKNDEEIHELVKNRIKKWREYIKFFKQNNIPENTLPYLYLQGSVIDVVTTMDARELYHFFNLRCCARAHWEIREIAIELLKQVRKIAPLIFKNAGPSCYYWGYCIEGDVKPESCNVVEIKKRFSSM